MDMDRVEKTSAWTAEEIDEAMRLRGEGLSYSQIAMRIGRSFGSTQGKIKRTKGLADAGLPARTRCATAWKPERVAMLTQLYVGMTSRSEILAALNSLPGPVITENAMDIKRKALKLRRPAEYVAEQWRSNIAKGREKQFRIAWDRKRAEARTKEVQQTPVVVTTADVAEFIARRGVTRCPAAVAWGADTRATISAADARAIEAHDAERDAARNWSHSGRSKVTKIA